MDLTHRLAISYYQPIATLNDSHKIYLVQHQETKKIFVKKILDVYNINIYEQLYKKPIVGVPKIIDYYEENEKLTVIEEYISGVPLSERLTNSELSLDDIYTYMSDLCDILDKLHSVSPSIVHRDIKPSNIIISNCNHAVLLDFNASKYFKEDEKQDTILLGTHGYAAPEQYGFGSSSPQTDIYALGVILKEMLLSVNCEDTKKTSHLEKIIEKCTQITPTQRYTNVNEIKCELSPYINSQLSSSLCIAHSFNKRASSYALPGFRSGTPWKILVSSLYYIFISSVCLTLKIENTHGFELWLQRIFLFAMLFSIILVVSDYRGIQKYMPLCKNDNLAIKILGIVLLCSVFVVSLFLILMIFLA